MIATALNKFVLIEFSNKRRYYYELKFIYYAQGHFSRLSTIGLLEIWHSHKVLFQVR